MILNVNRIKVLLTEQGKRQSDLARFIGMDEGSVSKLFKLGTTKEKTAIKIAECLFRQPHQLFDFPLFFFHSSINKPLDCYSYLNRITGRGIMRFQNASRGVNLPVFYEIRIAWLN